MPSEGSEHTNADPFAGQRGDERPASGMAGRSIQTCLPIDGIQGLAKGVGREPGPLLRTKERPIALCFWQPLHITRTL